MNFNFVVLLVSFELVHRRYLLTSNQNLWLLISCCCDEKLRLSLESVAERLSDDFMWVPAKNRQNDAMGEVESDGKITSKKRLSTRRRSSVFVLQKNDKENYELKVS